MPIAGEGMGQSPEYGSLSIELVACAVKLHNISSMIEDYNLIGYELWKRFNRDKYRNSGIVASWSIVCKAARSKPV